MLRKRREGMPGSGKCLGLKSKKGKELGRESRSQGDDGSRASTAAGQEFVPPHILLQNAP